MGDDPRRMRSRARVRATIEIECPSVWSGDTTIAQIVRQAQADARKQLAATIESARGMRALSVDVCEVIYSEEAAT